MYTYHILLGTNQGDLKSNIKLAIKSISKKAEIIKQSSVYQTEPFDMPKGTNDFLNQALIISSELDIYGIKKFTKKIEKNMGKISRCNLKDPYEDRMIDIDILFADDLIIDEPLIVPHPQITKRRFVLEPLNEIAGDFIHPVYKKSITVLLEQCKDTGTVKKLVSSS